MKTIYLIIVTFFLRSFLLFGQTSNWELSKNDNGIKVYTKEVQNSDFQEFRAVMTVPCTIQRAVLVIKDTENAHKWLHNCKTSELVKKENEFLQYNYIVNEMPFPFEDRDMIFKIQSIPAEKSYLIKLTGIPDYLAKKDGLTRMEKVEGKWELKQNGDNTLFISYSMHVEPGGNLPSWLVNTKVTEIPYETLSKLRNILIQ